MGRFTLLLAGILVWFSTASAQYREASRWPSVMELLEAGPGDSGGEVSVSATYTEINRLIIEENWEEAEALLAGLMEEEPQNRNFAYKRALCLRAMKGRLAEAVPFVQMAAFGEFADRYNAFDAGEVMPPEAALELALDVLHLSGKYSECQAVASVMMARYSKRDARHQEAEKVMEECAFALALGGREQPIRLTAQDALNGKASDYAPVVTPDGQTMYFTSNRDGVGGVADVGRIYRTRRTEKGWSGPIALGMGTPGRDVTTVGMLGDGEVLLVYQSYRGEGAVWALTQDGSGGWTQEKKVGFPVDSRFWETSMSERFDGQERIFVSNRPGGEGGRDLYRTVMLPDGSWSEPLNLGPSINTAGEEESPVLSADGQSLVFASNGLPGMGGFDLFRCRRLDNGGWSEPEHLGIPLNTPGDEAMISLDVSGQSGYLSSSRLGGDDLDIFRVDIEEEPEEALAVLMGEVEAWVEGDVMEVHAIDDGPQLHRVFRARKGSGAFVAALPPCREYRFEWRRGPELMGERTEVLGCDAAYGASREVIRLHPFTPGEKPAAEVDSEWEAVTDATLNPNLSSSQPEDETEDETEENLLDHGAAALASAPETEVVPASTSEETASMMVFEALESTVQFGYGKYVTDDAQDEVVAMARAVKERAQWGDIPVIRIEGSASFVPIKNKHAYDTNEQLARMRAEKARDALVASLTAKGLELGVDFEVELDWGVAGPEYAGDAVSGRAKYTSFQFAKFSLGRQQLVKRG